MLKIALRTIFNTLILLVESGGMGVLKIALRAIFNTLVLLVERFRGRLMAKQPTPKVITKKHLARMEKERIQQRYLMIGTGVVLALVLLLVLFGWFDQAILQKSRPVARIGSATVSISAFQTQVRYSRMQMIQQLQTFMGDPVYQQFFGQYITQLQSQLQNPTQIGQTVLDQMISSEVIRQEAKKMGITVSEEEVSIRVEEEFGFFENGTPTPTLTATAFSTSTLAPAQLALVPPTATPIPATATLEATATAAAEATQADVTTTPEATATAEATLAPTGSPTPDYTATPEPTATPYTREGFETRYKEVVKNFNDQIEYSEQDLRQLVRDQLLRDKVLAEVTKDMKPSEEQVWARHILVATEDEAKQARARLDAGEDFVKLAAELSTDTSNKDLGGDLGWFNRAKMVEPFSNAAFDLEIGQISQPVETSFGWHIIQVLGHEDRLLTASEFEQAKQDAFAKWIEDKKTELKVETFDRWIEVVPTEPEVPEQLLQQPQQQS